MAFDAHANFGYSTVATAPVPAASGVTLSVAAGTGGRFPATPFNAVVWPTAVQPLASNAEIVRVTGRVNDALTIVRTQEATAARAILVGDQIAAAVTAKMLTDIETAIPPAQVVPVISTGADGAEPAAVAGDLYYVNNGFYIERFSTLWQPWGPIWPLTKPIDANYAWVNQGGSSVSAVNGGILLTAPATAGDSMRIRKKAAPATPYTLTAQFLVLSGKRAAATYGIGFRESSSGKIHLFMVNHFDTGSLFSIKFTNETTFSATYTSTVMNTIDAPSMPPKFLRIADDGANRILSYSLDGYDFTQFHSIGRTDFLTANEILFFVNASDAAVGTKVRLLSWKEA